MEELNSMGYYQGDMISGAGRARMYRGDPGFLSFVGGLVKKGIGLLPGGHVASSAIEAIHGVSRPKQIMTAGREILSKGGRTIAKHPVLSAAGAAGAGAAALGAHHLLAGGHMRKHRRMNVYNPRALRRALRRAKGFAKMARQIVRIEHHYKHPKRFRIGHFTKKSHKK